MPAPHIDPNRFTVHTASPRGFGQAYVREGAGGVPLVCVHGWPESKRVFWKVIEPLAAAGFEVIVPDLRGFGDSDVGPDGFHDVASHSRDLYALVHDTLGHERVVLVGGDLGGPVVQDLALRHPEWVDRMVLLGIGGSYMGLRALFEALCHPYHNELDRETRHGTPRLPADCPHRCRRPRRGLGHRRSRPAR